MPSIYLSPSTQELNEYVTGGTEEEYMNKIADAMEPYLISSGIQFVRNSPDMTAASSIRQSNEGDYDVHLALHSNASGPGREGMTQGTDVYYYPGSKNGERLADIIAKNLKSIYPRPELVRTVPTTRLGEVARTKAPSVLIEFAFHDNVEDANWITQNIDPIAKNVVQSLTEYFGIPFIQPQPERQGVVDVRMGWLNIRNKPALFSSVVATARKGDPVTVLGKWKDWYLVRVNGVTGYANDKYIDLV